MDRDAFLSRVASGVIKAELPPDPQVPTDLPVLESVDLLELFRSRSQSVNAVVHGPVTRHSAPRAVVGIAGGHNINSFIAWDELPVPGVSAALASQGWDRVVADPEASPRDQAAALAGADLGVTGASIGLAESGSVVLSHGPGSGRLISLLPEVHVVLLHVDAIHRTLAHWAQEYPEEVEATANLVIVTGPSRTGDIELQLNLGVHGPKHVHVVLIK